MPARKRKRKKKVVAQDARATKIIDVQVFGEQDVRREEEIQIFESEPAFITVSAGTTKTTEVQYENIKINVSLTMPCYPEHVVQTYNHASALVEQLLEAECIAYGVPLFEEDDGEEEEERGKSH
ncbi:MAG: hypothetical protein KAJ73_00540 [Zetaproteobacteria bacterium]|nr:hypothetical protein [Zetaproteobacteria bacterium]